MTTTTAATSEPSPQRWLITASVMLATIMQALDTTIANVALPHMQGSLSATYDQISWVLTSYIVAAAIMTPPTGFFAARLGRKRVFLLSVAGFIISSMLCGAATSLDEMVLFRILQGVFGAALVPLSQSTLLDSYPPEQHGSAMAIWGIGIMVGPILGPTLGGWLTESYNWRWVFYINLPVGIMAFLGILSAVPETEPQRRRFDMLGFILLSVAIGALQLLLDRGQSQDWFDSTEIIVETLIASLAFYLFVVQMFTAEQPFLPPQLFRDRNFVTGQLFIFIVGLVLLANLALLPPFLQDLMGYPVLTAGILLAPRGVGTMISMMLVGRLINKVDARLMIFAGLLLTALSLWQMAQFTTDVSMWTIAYTGIVQGLGLGQIFVPLSTLTFATLEPKLRTEGSSLFSLTRNIGSSIGISIVMTLLARNIQINHATLSEHINPLNPVLQPPFLPPQWDIGTASGLAALDGVINQQAGTIAYLNDFRFMMVIVLLAIPLLPLLRRPRYRAPQPVATAVAD